MGIFSNSSPFDGDVDRVTDEKNTAENWGLIMDLCDRAAASPKEALRSIVRQLNHRNPHVQLQTITLLDACVNNCGKPFHLEVASREFEQEFRKHVSSVATHKRVGSRLLASLQKWAESEFKSDPQLALVPGLYKSLQQDGLYAQISEDEATVKKVSPASQDPNVVSSQQEEDDIAKAIALSMKETEKSPRAESSLYPSTSSLLSSTSSSSPVSAAASSGGASQKEERKVRALYDFEAAEDNELTFKAGEIVLVMEDSDPNWWLGNNHRGKGLFPSNFVTSDLSEEPEQWKEERHQRKSVQFNEEVEVKEVQHSTEPVSIDQDKISELLHLLNEADPTGERQDSAQLLGLEEQCLAMGPLIDQELERTDRRHAQLTKISADLVDALNLYQQLMREPPAVSGAYYPAAPPAGYYVAMAPPPGRVLPRLRWTRVLTEVTSGRQTYPVAGPMMPIGPMASYPQAVPSHMDGAPPCPPGPPGPPLAGPMFSEPGPASSAPPAGSDHPYY